MRLQLDIAATDGAARTGRVATAKGGFQTPVFMPVGTRGTIRAATTAQLADLGAEFMLGNTYHLMLRPGADVVAELGGLGRFAGWDGHLLTDSGGFQVFSLSPKVTDEGVRFKSVYDGSAVHCTPESIVSTQELLGADIQMVLDVCLPLPAGAVTWPGRCGARPSGPLGHGPPTPGARTRRCSASCRAGWTPTCDASRPSGPWHWTSTATPSGASRLARSAA